MAEPTGARFFILLRPPCASHCFSLCSLPIGRQGREARMTKAEKKRAPVGSAIDGRAPEVYRTAARIILQKGYDGTSVSDIADALGITKAGLYHYISGKTELL